MVIAADLDPSYPAIDRPDRARDGGAAPDRHHRVVCSETSRPGGRAARPPR